MPDVLESKEKTVYVLRGRTFHLSRACVSGPKTLHPLSAFLSAGGRPCINCALLPLLREDFLQGVQYAWVKTWDITDDSLPWQHNKDKRKKEAKVLRKAAKILGLKVRPGVSELDVDAYGKMSDVAMQLLSGVYPLVKGPVDGSEPSEELLEIFVTLYKDAGAPYEDDLYSVKEREKLWGIASTVLPQ